MSNMSYCRFRNTLTDLLDCEDYLLDNDDVSEEEARARSNLIMAAARITKHFTDVNLEEVKQEAELEL